MAHHPGGCQEQDQQRQDDREEVFTLDLDVLVDVSVGVGQSLEDNSANQECLENESTSICCLLHPSPASNTDEQYPHQVIQHREDENSVVRRVLHGTKPKLQPAQVSNSRFY